MNDEYDTLIGNRCRIGGRQAIWTIVSIEIVNGEAIATIRRHGTTRTIPLVELTSA